MTVSSLALQVLDAIESIEMRSLEWGFTNGSLAEAEVIKIATGVSRHHGSHVQGEDLVEELLEARLIFEMQGSGSAIRIRSRIAELMRLLAANRQLFPNRPWQGAPHLVADFRIDRRARRFPRRDRPPGDVLTANESVIASSGLRRDLWLALTSREGMKLAAFQERATIRLATPVDDAGTIVTAGTGSGKTIAFYLPAMLRVGEAIGPDFWVKAVAIYPRVELLKDQFAEAFRMARTIDDALAANGRRPLRIGALFRATPRIASRHELVDKKWQQRGPHFVCPWMRCPSCDAELLWKQEYIQGGVERLDCSQSRCAKSVSEDQIALTRTRLQKQPPDILFTTTEILNQRLSDHWMRGLFGVGMPSSKKPFLALLDEVHTYSGSTGAQAALTLRRWRHLLSGPVGWVGLSATLQDAARFFSDLCGASVDRVIEITPDDTEYEEQGAEYQILLRGDPGSRTSLLSTTIQTAMLLTRSLDPPGADQASGAFGRRAFLFTDDLDVTNRIFDDMRDAEAYTIFGQPDPHREPLANLRRGGPDAAIRDLEGQRWRLCEDIGHPLDRRLVIGRTTSQDAGVNQLANLVVATASLEVGFNDPLVGAVIQHKAPRGMASFLQRKGRAGRDRAMRPITLTVLSDYGRDRAFYQAYEHLFDPTIEPQHLPVQNPYVLKIQAVFALFDWLGDRTFGPNKAWQWDVLSRPHPNPNSELKTAIGLVRSKLTLLVRGDGETLADLRKYLMSALSVDSTTVDNLLWEAPRSLLLEAVPTLARRLFSEWRLAFPNAVRRRDLQADYHPLPDFVPRSLFSDLSLPEVRVVIPPATTNHEERIETMPILQAINQLVPGRVTRRFAHERGALAHWVPVDPTFPEQDRRISEYAEEHAFVGTFVGRFNDHVDDEAILVFRPWTVRLAVAARNVALPSSNARLVWRTDILPNGDPLSVPIPARSEWRTYVDSVEFFLHRFGSSASIRRFAPVASANVRTLRDDFFVHVNFKSDEGRPAALGFELEVDGFRVDLKLPSIADVSTERLPASVLSVCKLAYLRDTLRADSRLPSEINEFQRDWLFQFLTSALISELTVTGKPIEAVVNDLLSDARVGDVFREVMTEFFGAGAANAVGSGVSDDDQAHESLDDGDADGPDDVAGIGQAVGHAGPGRLQQALSALFNQGIVRERLRSLASQFLAPDSAGFSAWLRRVVLDTLGEAMLQACITSAPRHAMVDTLLVDVRDDEATGTASVWITESTIGGAGVLQAFADRFASEPRVFYAALEAALVPTDLELVDPSLREILRLAVSDPDVEQDLARLRESASHAERQKLWRVLSKRLAKHGGVELSHALSVSLNARLLRAGSGPKLDRLLVDLQDFWDRLEEQYGLAIGLREFSYVCSRDARLSGAVRSFLSATLPPAAISQVTIHAAITSLLWPRADEVRQQALRSYNPYRLVRSTDPAVVRHLLLRRSSVSIEIADAQWQQKLASALEAHGACRLSAGVGATADLRNAVVHLIATPVNVGVLQFFPVVDRVERSEGRVFAYLTLREHA